jgi:hypothetical protein
MIDIGYLAFAYKNPLVLKREIATLSSSGNCAFFVHIDRKVDIEEFSFVRGENVFFSDERLPVYWGEFSGIEAIVLLIRQALESCLQCKYLVLLSGSEYPLRTGKYISRFLKSNNGAEFISLVRVPASGKPISRITTIRFPSNKPTRRFASRVLARVGLCQRDYRKHLPGLEPYAGSTWWALSRDACQYILDFTKGNPQVERYFRNTFVPEESFFHTILGNSSFRPRIRRNLVYEDWGARGAHPSLISEAHVRRFREQENVWLDDMYGSGEALFARKFSDGRLDLVDLIDEMIRRKEGGAPLQRAAHDCETEMSAVAKKGANVA